MVPIKEVKKFITFSKEELNSLKGGEKKYSIVPKKGDWHLTEDTFPPHD